MENKVSDKEENMQRHQIRMPKEIWDKAKKLAKSKGLNTSALIRLLISQAE